MKLNKIKTGFSTKMKFTLEVFLMNMYILHDVFAFANLRNIHEKFPGFYL